MISLRPIETKADYGFLMLSLLTRFETDAHFAGDTE